MKRKKLTPAALCVALAVLLAVSCGKTVDPVTPATPTPKTKKEMLTGIWLTTHRATDANSDNTLDESEKTAIPSNEYYSATLNADGTGSMKIIDGGFDSTLNLKWELRNNDEDFFVDIDAIDTATSKILTLTDTDFVIWDNIDEPTMPREWSIMKKQ